MFSWFKRQSRRPSQVDIDRWLCQTLYSLAQGMEDMALDVSKLNAAVSRISTSVDVLVAAHADPAGQAAVDAAAVAVNAVADKADAAVAPVTPAASA